MSKVEKAVERYMEGFSCSQSVFVVYRQPDVLSERNALKLSTALGAGICGTGHGLCGAASGALLALSLKHGMADLDSLDHKTATYRLGQELLSQFASRLGASTCEGILGVNPQSQEYKDRAKELRATKCANAVRTASEILESLMEENG